MKKKKSKLINITRTTHKDEIVVMFARLRCFLPFHMIYTRLKSCSSWHTHLFKVLLVVLLSTVKSCYRCDDSSNDSSSIVRFPRLHFLADQILLQLVLEPNGVVILRPWRAVRRIRRMILEEFIQQLSVRNHSRIEGHLHSFGMILHISIRRIRLLSTGISNHNFLYTLYTRKTSIRAPKSSQCEHSACELMNYKFILKRYECEFGLYVITTVRALCWVCITAWEWACELENESRR